VLHDTQIRIHATQKSGLFFLARLFLARLVIMLVYSIVKITFGARANINTIGFNYRVELRPSADLFLDTRSSSFL
jgi:hypothetical protein